MASTPPAAPPRWMSYINLVLAIIGTVVLIGGALTAFGGWRSQVDAKIGDLDRRMTTAESNQKTYIPILLGLTKDVSYLADRARQQEQDQRDRERERAR